ncbi:MAG: DUF481 domain-containing protein [Phycisphaerae bacterium]|nr:DUF481 domain-containing protein [Phycisphaerae bacterium]
MLLEGHRGCARWTSLAALSLWMVAASFGDAVTLRDGSRLIGRVERMGDGKIKLITQFAGDIEIDASALITIETDEPVNVGLTTGDRLVGSVHWSPTVDRVVVETDMGGIPVSVEKIEAVWKIGDKSPEELAVEALAQKAAEEFEAKLPKWTLTIEAGAIYKEGNTDRLEGRGKIEAKRKTDVDLMRLYAQGAYSEENDVRSTAEVKAGAYYEHLLFNDRFFLYGSTEAEYDEFENLDLRYTVVGGPGYYWIKQETHELKTRTGLGYQHESFMDGTRTNEAIMDVGLNYRLDITPWVRFTEDASYYPTFESVRDHRLLFDTAFVFPIGTSDMWKIKLGVTHEYDALPQPGYKRLDTTYYANILAEFK